MWHGPRHGSLLSSSHCTLHLESQRGSNDPKVADEEKEGSWTVGGGSPEVRPEGLRRGNPPKAGAGQGGGQRGNRWSGILEAAKTFLLSSLS